MNEKNFLHSDITEKLIKIFYKVYSKLGYGFLERVYENAMFIELQKTGLILKTQSPIKVYYDDLQVGLYFADLLIDDKVIVELKAAEGLCEEHETQLINYLKATEIEVGIFLNFGKKPEIRRKVFNDEYKNLKKSSTS
ncbi:MAG: GxxExxY protein [Bacteroidia bacterium]